MDSPVATIKKGTPPDPTSILASAKRNMKVSEVQKFKGLHGRGPATSILLRYYSSLKVGSIEGEVRASAALATRSTASVTIHPRANRKKERTLPMWQSSSPTTLRFLRVQAGYEESHAVSEVRIILDFRGLAPKGQAQQMAGWEPTQDRLPQTGYRQTVKDVCETNARCHVVHECTRLTGAGGGGGSGLGARLFL